METTKIEVKKIADINPLYLICSELGIQDLFRKSFAIIKITLGERKKVNQCYTLLLHHGKGTAKSALSKDIEFLGYINGIDIEITGHTHKGMLSKDKCYEVNKFVNKVVPRLRSYVITNSFLGECDYGKKSMLIGACNELAYVDIFLQRDKKIRLSM